MKIFKSWLSCSGALYSTDGAVYKQCTAKLTSTVLYYKLTFSSCCFVHIAVNRDSFAELEF